MLWNTEGREMSPAFLGDLTPERVLFEYEGPRSFLARDPHGDLLFCHQCGESDIAWRYAVVPFDERMVESLEQGVVDLRTALDQPRLWLADVGASGKVLACRRVRFAEIPETCRPHTGVVLYPETEPLLSVRYTGEKLDLGQASLGTLKETLDGVRKALKSLAEFATGNVAQRGKPKARTRRYYDLPARLLAGSVRVVVRSDMDPQKRLFEDEVWKTMGDLLATGLAEALEGDDVQTPDSEPAETRRRIALSAVAQLATAVAATGDVVEIEGQLLPSSRSRGPWRIDHAARTRLRRRLKHDFGEAAELFDREGYITELDREEATFQLRDENGYTICKLSYEDQFFESVKEAFDESKDRKVRVIAERTSPSAAADLLALTPVEESPSSENASPSEVPRT